MNVAVFIPTICSMYVNVCRKHKDLVEEWGGERWLLSHSEIKTDPRLAVNSSNHKHHLLIKEQVADKEQWELALLVWKLAIDAAFRCLCLCAGVDVGVVTVNSLLYAWCLPGRQLTDHWLKWEGKIIKMRLMYLNASCWPDCILLALHVYDCNSMHVLVNADGEDKGFRGGNSASLMWEGCEQINHGVA